MRIFIFFLFLYTTKSFALDVTETFPLSPDNYQKYGFIVNIRSEYDPKCAFISIPVAFQGRNLSNVSLYQTRGEKIIFNTVLFNSKDNRLERKEVDVHFCGIKEYFNEYSLYISYIGNSPLIAVIEEFKQFEKIP